MVAVIVGSSGSGKSSTVFAGLLPRLRETDGWKIVQLRPGMEPLQSLSAALLPMLDTSLDETERQVEIDKMTAGLSEMELPLLDIAQRVLEVIPVPTAC